LQETTAKPTHDPVPSSISKIYWIILHESHNSLRRILFSG